MKLKILQRNSNVTELSVPLQQGDSAVAAKAKRLLKTHFNYTVGEGSKKK